MGYITPAQLAESPRAQEIAQAATPENAAIVATDLMDAVLRGADTSSFDPALVAVAQTALAVVNSAIDDASNLIDGFVGKRYTLPFASPPAILTAWSRAIVRYKLNQNLISDAKLSPIARDYTEAVANLKLVASGLFSLGADDPTASGGLGLAQVNAPGRTFTGDSLDGFTGGLNDYQS